MCCGHERHRDLPGRLAMPAATRGGDYRSFAAWVARNRPQLALVGAADPTPMALRLAATGADVVAVAWALPDEQPEAFAARLGELQAVSRRGVALAGVLTPLDVDVQQVFARTRGRPAGVAWVEDESDDSELVASLWSPLVRPGGFVAGPWADSAWWRELLGVKHQWGHIGAMRRS